MKVDTAPKTATRSNRGSMPITHRLRKEGCNLTTLYNRAVAEGYAWKMSTFRAVAGGWGRHREISTWLIQAGYGDELREARKLTGKGDKPYRKRTVEEIKTHLLANRIINPETRCWEWSGSCKQDGSGQMTCVSIAGNRSPVLVRRIAAFFWLGLDIKSDLVVAPRCENKSCFNPDHLSIGTMLNRRRNLGIQKGSVLSNTKLKEVIELLRLKMHPQRVARLTGVHRLTVWRIKTLRAYKDECRSLGWNGDHGRAKIKLSDHDVVKIKELLAQGHTQASIAKIYNVHYSLICRIHKGNRRQSVLQQEAANVG